MHTHMLWRTRCQSEGTTINITTVEYYALQLLTQAREVLRPNNWSQAYLILVQQGKKKCLGMLSYVLKL